MKRHAKQTGMTTANGIGILVCLAAGAWLGDFLVGVIGVEEFSANIRFLTMSIAILLAPVWTLYSDLKKLKDQDAVSRRQAREIDFRVRRGHKWLSKIFIFYLLTALILASSGLWPKELAVFQWFARISGAFMILSVGLVFNILRAQVELNHFEARLSRLKQENAAKDALLESISKAKNAKELHS